MDEIVRAIMETGGQIGFDELQRMRQQTPTGGMGNVTNRDLELLAQEMGRMVPEQSYESWHRENFGDPELERIINNARVMYGDRWSPEIEAEIRRNASGGR